MLLLSPILAPTSRLNDGLESTETLLVNPCLVGARVFLVSLSGVKYDMDDCLLGAPGFRTRRDALGGALGDSEHGEGIK